MIYDLIIVGMGPVGATAANLAGLWGLNALALDKAEGIYENPRAMGLDHEVMRAFDNIGLAERIASHVMPYRASHYVSGGARLIKRIDAAKPPYLLGWSPNYVFSQPPVERALRERINEFQSVRVQLGCEVLDIEQKGPLSQVHVRNRDGHEALYSSHYVLACDGGTSPIRMRLQLPMDDLAFDEPWLVVDVTLKEGAGADLPQTNVQYCEVERPCTFVVGPGRHRRWEFMINPGESPSDIANPESIRTLISRWLPPDAYDIWRASSYRFHALILQQWRHEQTFFLGDAAHMTPPFLAQGMCQGIRDAMNLIWKLALVRRGLAQPSLLDSYQNERAPHVRCTTEVAKTFGQTICERDAQRAAERDERLVEQLQARPDGTMTRQSLIPGLTSGFIDTSAGAGELFPQPLVRNHGGETDLLDRFTGQSLRLVLSDKIADPGLAPLLQRLCAHLPLHVIQLVEMQPSAQAVAEQYQEQGDVLGAWMRERDCQVVLVRPDHYVYGTAQDGEQALALVQRLLAALAT
ncbi:bifunctional 3-(3-hydroxy-phenyl)propionate/3-hydroxycinnamic acid hydroxylase [Pseudomonas vanderleydeniana]|uniref:Bifunctional 3-(3-hydroxy-phenyl)propionate/3-hydroxycinnamic acid hydroxylase n=1 Tax=Pseudomonas vanderleydeniana TaxID=2745495 RepID=A0A9E6PHV2_9PSED|nr:bifunctional 3-(3-hydroxy-phenyl)propionate/3-hydroxycinnamic acid hydroxylase [Pseudomonas vanderleydeniana]QXI26386.1 bifunctional 3-(3-hydroxy-phenyl)propionate/3-hydroxycinnamic acid hydroxylase [Pseudomonas vanderleydeniana]